MEPGDDIIDVLYRYQYEANTNQVNNNNNSRPHHHHGQSDQGGPAWTDYTYHQGHPRQLEEEEPIYVPRSIKADIIHKSDDDFIRRRHPRESLVELSSGAFQKKMTMTMDTNGNNVRRRGVRSAQERHHQHQPKNCLTTATANDVVSPTTVLGSGNSQYDRLWKVGDKCLGTLIMIFLSHRFSLYLRQLHENDMWFSEITQVEREISFRTEQGLYYSYFKQLIEADTLLDGVHQLRYDNKTESANTINILQRFNVYQELVLALIYRLIKFDMEPTLFYVDGVFYLQMLFYSALYMISWCLSGTWMSAVLAIVYTAMNRMDITRIHFTVPLREHFSLPFMFTQFCVTGAYLKQGGNFYLVLQLLFTILYTVTWQFAQFVTLLQAFVLFSLAVVRLADKEKVSKLLMCQLVSMLVVWCLHFYSRMILVSLVTSFIPVSLLVLHNYDVNRMNTFIRFTLRSATIIILSVVGSFVLNSLLKMGLNESADNHIFKYIVNRILPDQTDFETRLYICNAAFNWLDKDTYLRLCATSVLPLYVAFLVLCCVSYTLQIMKSCSVDKQKTDNSHKQAGGGTPFSTLQRPDLCFHLAQSLLLGVLASTTLRMKCFWTPYLCVLSSVAVADPQLWQIFSDKLFPEFAKRYTFLVKFAALGALILSIGSKQLSVIDTELSELREFYDPDTVELMHWIERNTDRDDVVSGSMQLMAGVKLCTGRTISNHPHFEDKALRDRTRQLYQFYGKVSPEEVYSVLLKYKVNYIVLEDSICFSSGSRCGTVDTVDLANWHIPQDGVQSPQYLVQSQYPRFCDEVRYDTPEYRKYFTKVFENSTFRIYKVVKV